MPLSAISHFEQKTTALAVNHKGQFPAVTISFNLDPGLALGDAVREIEAATLQMGMPATIHPSFFRNGAGLPGFAQERAVPDSGGADDRVHRAGHAV